MKRLAILTLLVGLAASPLFAQIPTGTLSGHVTDGKNPLPGVTVTVTSPNLQGARVSTTSGNGDYIFAFLPPGDYKVLFELQGFQTIETSVRINAAQTQRVDATMPQAKVAEQVTVTGAYETLQTQGAAATTMAKELIYKLPVAKDINNIALLTAGVVANPGASNAVTIAGAASFENLFMVDGVNIEDNVRGTPTALYIEDAVQETTTSVSSVSAEYGRFSGGVVNMLTKSGGNDFHASYRDTLTNDKWAAKTPKTTAQRLDTIINQHEVTLGGFFVKDHLWFFGAFRQRNTELSGQTYYTNQPYTTGAKENRYEGKLTFAINPNHRVIGSYLKVDHSDFGYGFNPSGYNFLDLASVYERTTPTDLLAFNYTGVLTDNFFVEAQYSEKHFTFQNAGSRYTDLGLGTPIDDYAEFGFNGFYNSPIFCGVCAAGSEKRDNKEYLGKASWFVSSPGLGSHDIVLGYDQFQDMRTANNYQSGSSWFVYEFAQGPVRTDATHFLLDSRGTPYPVITSGADVLFWAPISELTSGNNFSTNSIFANDKWRLNNNFSFNIGVRYDKNGGNNASGTTTTNDSNISPRLGVTYDPSGDSAWQFNASYAKYVAAIANTQADATAAGGQPASLSYVYEGPDINTNCDPVSKANCLTAPNAINAAFQWFNGLTQAQKNALLVYANIPGLNVSIPNSLKSPNTTEYTIGFSHRLGTKGEVRLDYVNRKYGDFYNQATTGTTVADQYGTLYDVSIINNNNSVLKREYNGVHVSAEYRVSDVISLGGNYTWSTLKGNWNAENGGSGPLNGGTLYYPEYRAYPEYNPNGYLLADQRHRARIYGVWDLYNAKHNRLSVSLLETYASGTPYGAVAGIRMSTSYVPTGTPNYVSPPLSAGSAPSYYFTSRDAFRWDNMTRTDLSFNYAFVVPALGTDLQFYLEPRVTNVFNEHAVLGGNSTVYTANSSGHGLAAFNPFTTAPVECQTFNTAHTICQDKDASGKATANWMTGPLFGQGTAPGSYQAPRTFVVSLGVRF